VTIIFANELDAGSELRSKVCVIGGGAAGITLVRALASNGIDSLLIESGTEEFDGPTQELYAGRAERYFDLTTTRLRYLGGTTNHFAGQSRPFESIDLEAQPWRGDVGWPISHAELMANMAEATRVMGFTEDEWATSSWFPDLDEPLDPHLRTKVFQALARPFGTAYRDDLASSERITVVLSANATGIRLSEGNGAVSHVELRTLGGTGLRAVGDVYVLAAGGIESPRLLLASDQDVPTGVGNSSGLVGRYFADHPAIGPIPVVPGPGTLSLASTSVTNPTTGLPVSILTTLSITEQAQRDLELTGFHAFVLGIEAPPPDDVVAEGVEKLLGIGEPTPDVVRSVVIGFEAIPNIDSRVTLDGERNALGEPRAVLDWRRSPRDSENIASIIDLVARELARTGVGRMAVVPDADAWDDLVTGQHHHMGTLRMSASPADGVVDSSLRFHDVTNLYALGSAVFPTHGHANPTMNIVALALRLADHLGTEVM